MTESIKPAYNEYFFEVAQDDPTCKSIRVDQFISRNLPDISRSRIGAKDAVIIINGHKVKKSRIIEPGDKIQFFMPEEIERNIGAQDIPLEIVYQDAKVLVINKEQGMVVHPAAGNWDGTVANAILFHAETLQKGEGTFRPGIVHRLDKDTSGILITAKDMTAHAFLSDQFKEHTVEKVYIALVKGIPAQRKGVITSRLVRDPRNRKKFTTTSDETAGRDAETHYRVLRIFSTALGETYSLVRLMPRTGRTHQLRVHMRSLGHPILGDPVYSRTDQKFRGATLMLHALELNITIPNQSNGVKRTFKAPLPDRFKKIIRSLIPDKK